MRQPVINYLQGHQVMLRNVRAVALVYQANPNVTFSLPAIEVPLCN
jgi:hypothetical protein